MEYQVFSTRHLDKKLRRVCLRFFALLCVQCLFCLLFILIAVASDSSRLCEVACVRWILCITYVAFKNFFTQDDCVRCVSYYRNRRTLYPSLTFAFIWFSYHYDTVSRGNALLCVFFGIVFLADHRKLLCVSLYRCSRCAVTLQRASRLNCDHACLRFSGVSYDTLTHSRHCIER